MIRYRTLLIAAGYPDGNDCDALIIRSDPAFKMAVGRLPESGEDLCSQPTISRLENSPSATALKRMMAAMIELFCDSFEQVPRRILLDIDDTADRVHGGQQLALFNAHYDSRCFLPIHICEAITGKPVAVILRPGKTPDSAEVALVLRHVIGRIRARWPAVEAFLDMLGVFAEFEANLRRERRLEGISAAKARGVYKGRKPSIDAVEVSRLRREEKLGPVAIARRLGIGRTSVYRLLGKQAADGANGDGDADQT